MNQNHQNRDPNQPLSNPPENPAYGQYPPMNSASNVPQPGYNPPPYGGNYPPPYGQAPGQVPPRPGKKQKKAQKPKKPGNAKWVWLGILVMLILMVVGGILGYNAAVSARKTAYNQQSVKAAAQQYQLALTDMENGNYENAKTRLEYVLSINPNYPGATEKYTEAMVNLYPKETPTPFYTPTPAPTATLDTRSEEEMLNTIRGNMAAGEWETALANMDALRNKNLSYQSIEVDGLYYIALRNYGIQQISSGYLEPGIYRITLAEAFGPVDAQAENQRLAARNYLAGAGFWEIDWEKALSYYSNAYQTTPGMYDRASGFTAQQRYAEASFQYGNKLVEREQYCDAVPYYEQGLAAGVNPNYGPTATAVWLVCNPPTNTPEAPTPMLYTPTIEGAAPIIATPDVIVPPAEPVEPPAEEIPPLEIPDTP